MRGIKFTTLYDDTYSRHTADDWGLVMAEKTIGTPTLKYKFVDLSDRDGVLDFTTALRGVPSYGTRRLTFRFEYLDAPEDWTKLFTEIRGFLHGQRMKIQEPDDEDYYYLGRVTVSDPSGGLVKEFTITVIADTWKYKNGPITEVTWPATTGSTIVLLNDWRPVSPKITTTGAVTFVHDDKIYSIAGAGTFQFPTIALKHGSNIVYISEGTGDITFTYQEGAI